MPFPNVMGYMKEMLELVGIVKKFGTLRVVEDLSFTLKPGEIVGYLGPNGAGKSTTVKMICGLLAPTSGSILYRGESIRRDLPAFRAKVGYVPEQGELYPYLSGYEYLEMVGQLRGFPPSGLARRIERVLDLLGLRLDMHHPIGSYSKGMRQKVLITAALLHDPELLILDEPMDGLDVTTNLVLKDILVQLAAQGKTILYSSHILEVVEHLSTRVLILNRGRLVADEATANLHRLKGDHALEGLFRELVQTVDSGSRAGDILSAIQDEGRR